MGGEEGSRESIESEQTGDEDTTSSGLDLSGLDRGGYPDADEFNAMVAETSGDGEYRDVDADFDFGANDCEAPANETIPEMEIVLQNIGI
ncbi:MAG: hypothetical protein ABSD67_20625 [Terracidiphilus sp.]|jgi:hypothetical protein